MSKYGKGLNKEIYLAVNNGELATTFGISEVREFIKRKGWNVPDSYINVCLANGAAENHSLAYKKYFRSIGDGVYTLAKDY